MKKLAHCVIISIGYEFRLKREENLTLCPWKEYNDIMYVNNG
jgi:hypothetical protein